jgi:hypothetical protein
MNVVYLRSPCEIVGGLDQETLFPMALWMCSGFFASLSLEQCAFGADESVCAVILPA